MIVVAGHLRVAPEQRASFLERSKEAIVAARSTLGCLDFVVAADPIDEGRVDVCERWVDRPTLRAFRGAGPGPDLSAMIASYAIEELEVDDAAATRDLMSAFNDAFQRHDPSVLPALVADDCTIENVDGTVHRGKEACLALWTRIATEVTFVLEEVVVVGERALIFWRIEGGPRGINVMRTHQGRIVEARGYVKSGS